ncbi:hypothetical protein [Malacoplasma iowae]|uniref:Uncharacterized protein n=2 Tax=Malacoplasma iowae TaxID=2116 RepID=A0A084U3N5_MALIO|nr:hypothetical protein [Malacoplasma iowae]VEU61795.1 Uncharacterised protein [Mycoplasmopsis fermentans]EGZ30837.1 hypothetical protein GUU_04836 [Malacoplasma iowae 695]KFB07571.1 hypothetical protein P271_416 [Malacoplasma iowae DK-CPA]QHG90120.1 hypothetical protein EER00_04515 [Malacoplasma iowae 695]WPL36141.1 hypothetical protein QX180_01830 [Malacoplasma iowae]
MEKIINFVFCINELLEVEEDEQTKQFTDLICNLINEGKQSKSLKTYFLIDKEFEIDEKQQKKSIQKEKIKSFLKKHDLKILENDIKFIFKSKEDEQIDVDTAFDDIAVPSSRFNFSKEDTIIFFTDPSIGETAFFEGYWTVFLDCPSLPYDQKELKEIRGLSSYYIRNDINKVNLDSIKYDFLTFLENK